MHNVHSKALASEWVGEWAQREPMRKQWSQARLEWRQGLGRGGLESQRVRQRLLEKQGLSGGGDGLRMLSTSPLTPFYLTVNFYRNEKFTICLLPTSHIG